MKTQTDNQTASAPETRTPRNLKSGTVVENIYTGQINTVKCTYWQAYAGGNTSDYTVEFEPTPDQPTGWSKSTNLRVISTPDQRTIPAEKPTHTDNIMCLIAEYDELKAHADKLAEALREMCQATRHSLTWDDNYEVLNAATNALAAYESDVQP